MDDIDQFTQVSVVHFLEMLYFLLNILRAMKKMNHFDIFLMELNANWPINGLILA